MSKEDWHVRPAMLRRRDGTFALGVADGVYMWKQQGIDSGLFSRSLMTYARQAVIEGERDPVKGE